MHLRDRILRAPSRRVLVGVAVALLLYAAVGFLVVPRIVLSKLPPALSAALHRPVTLKGVKANPFTLSLTLEGLRVGEKEGPGAFVTVERLFANAQLSSLYHRGPVLSEAVVEAPAISIARTGAGTLSISDLIEELSKEKPDSKPARFSVANIRVERGAILFDDRPARTKHAVTELKVGVPFLSNLPVDQDVFTEPFLGAKVNGAAFELKGKTKPFHGTRETTLDIHLSDIDLPYYFAYVPAEWAKRLTSGRLDTELALSFRQESGKDPAVVLSGRAALRQFLVSEEGAKPLIGLKRLEIVLASADLLRRDVRLESVTVDAPEVRVHRDRGGGFPVFEKLLGAFTGEPAPGPTAEPAKSKGGSWRVDVNAFAVAGGRIFFRDERPRRPFEAVAGEIAIAATGISTAAGQAATLKVSATTDAGERLEYAAKLTLDPLVSEGTLSFTGIPLKRYGPYYEDGLLFAVEGGKLDFSTRYRWPVAGELAELSDLSVAVTELRARRNGEKEEFLRIPSASMTGGAVDPGKREVRVASIAASGANLKIVREKDGSIDLAKLAKEEPTPAPKQLAAEGKATGGGEWTARLASISLERGSVRFADEAAPHPVTLEIAPMSFSVEGLSTAHGEKGKVRGKVALNGKGSLAVAGTFGLSPVLAQLKVDAADLELPPFAGYAPETVQVSLTRGTISAKGEVSVKEGPDGALAFGWEGEATCGKLALLDPTAGQDLLSWDSLRVGGMKATSTPPSFVAGTVALTDFFARVELDEAGKLNFRRAFGLAEPPPVDDAAAESAMAGGKAPEPQPTAAAATPAAPGEGATYVRIDAVTLQGGRLHVDDRFVKPGYRADLKDVGGRISGLSSVAGTRAEVDLRGSLESSAPLEITGTFNPFSATSFADIKVAFRDIDLVPMTPYFVKYAGYSVQKGRLTMNVAYKLNERRLEAQNSFLVDQFTFGEKVESPTATKLPVKLAVSLLKDPDGVIRLDVPISGSVDDPKFRVGPIVWKIIGNVLKKAVLSPFALLGRLGGGGPELSFVDFAPGASSLDGEAVKRLDALAAALGKRPALKLEVEGKVDAAKDAEGLQRLLYERKVKVRKAEELAKAGTPAASVDEVVVSKEEWPEYLERAYRKERFPKPRTALGLVKQIPPEEMEKLMLANLVVTPDDLRQLALARATVVKERLLGPGQVAPDRVFLVDPAAAAEPKPGESLTRAAFVLK